jgi:hypothetical protein
MLNNIAVLLSLHLFVMTVPLHVERVFHFLRKLGDIPQLLLSLLQQVRIAALSTGRKDEETQQLLFINPSVWSDERCSRSEITTCRGVTGTARRAALKI